MAIFECVSGGGTEIVSLISAKINVNVREETLYGANCYLISNGEVVQQTTISDTGTARFDNIIVPDTYTVEVTLGAFDSTRDVVISSDDIVNNREFSVGFGEFEIVTFADGTDEQIAGMVQAHYEGFVNVADYWSLGDTRTVAYNGGTVQITIVDFNKLALTTNIGVRDKAAIVCRVSQLLDKVAPSMSGDDNLPANTAYKDLPIRSFISTTVLDRFDTFFKGMVKAVNRYAHVSGATSEAEVVSDTLFMASGPEILNSDAIDNAVTNGRYIRTNPSEGEQFAYYNNSANIQFRYFYTSSMGTNEGSISRVGSIGSIYTTMINWQGVSGKNWILAHFCW